MNRLHNLQPLPWGQLEVLSTPEEQFILITSLLDYFRHNDHLKIFIGRVWGKESVKRGRRLDAQ